MEGLKRSRKERDEDKEAALQASVFGEKGHVVELMGQEREQEVSKSTQLWERKDISAPTQGTDSAIAAYIRECARSEHASGHKNDGNDHVSSDSDDIDDGEKHAQANRKAPAWEDEDDEQVKVNVANVRRLRKLRKIEGEEILSGEEYKERLRQQFERSKPDTSWAKQDRRTSDQAQQDDSYASKLFRTTAPILGKSRLLEPKILSVDRLVDANYQEPSKAVIQSVKFHPNGQFLLTAGLDKTLRLFRIDGKRNEKVASIYFDDLPIHNAKFTPNGKEIICTGRRPYFYVYNLSSGTSSKIKGVTGHSETSWESFAMSPSASTPYIALLGRDGYIPLLSLQSKQWITDLKMNGQVRDVCFSGDGKHVLATGTEGHVYRWSLSDMNCISCHIDQGSLGSSQIASDPTGYYYAVGSKTGVVNIYEEDNMAEKVGTNQDSQRNAVFDAFASHHQENGTHKFSSLPAPSPIKAVMNLTTTVDLLRFNHDGQILALGSRRKKDQFKLVHVASKTVFQNWPTSQTPLHYVTSIDFSPGGGFLAIGNDRGRVLLYRLNHYFSS